MIDSEGFRANVGIILCNKTGQLFWGRLVGKDAWQFPQGGIKKHENVEDAMYRELYEEIGLFPEQVEVIGCTDDWLKYWLPEKFIRHNIQPLCIGQKQIWYLLKLLVNEDHVDLGMTENPEFDEWKWIDYWDPIQQVVNFKRKVYEQALNQLAPYMLPMGLKGFR